MSRESDVFSDLLNRIQAVRQLIQVSAINLGGSSGSGGGNGGPIGGIQGQLPQTKVAGDLTEATTLTSGSATSLLDNLNNIRYWVHGGASASTGLASTILYTIDGGGSAITTGIKGDLVVDFNCIVNSATLLADQSGSIVVDIWKNTYLNYPPVDADSITASTPPTLSGAIKSQDITLAGWTPTITAGDILRYNVDSVATVERVLVALKVTRT